MSTAKSVTAIPVSQYDGVVRGRAFGALVETTKPGITRLVAFTTFVGYALVALAGGPLTTDVLLAAGGCALGTAFCAAGANSLNMWMEVARDRRMPRTADRPLPKQRLELVSVLRWGVGLVVVGVAALAIGFGPAPALLALLSAALYLFAYTPLKLVTPWCTVVGAVPGALPTLIGAAAASTSFGFGSWLEPVGLALFGLLAVWQLPHFFALAWMYRDDYAAGGMKMLTVVDPTGRRAREASVAGALLFIPASIAPAWTSPLLGPVYVAIATAAGLAFLCLTVRLWRTPTDAAAKVVFFASIIHLPVLLTAMASEAAIRSLF